VGVGPARFPPAGPTGLWVWWAPYGDGRTADNVSAEDVYTMAGLM
jgi:hypothetical protein